MFYQETAALRPTDYDIAGRLQPSALLALLELIGAHHSESVGDGLVRDGVAWLLSQWRVEIHRWPLFGEPIALTTWTRTKSRAAFVYREFQATAPDGTEYFRARAKLTRFDLSAQRLVRIDDESYAAYGPEEKTLFSTELPRMTEQADDSCERPLQLRRGDMDYNGHVHNTRYLDYAVDMLPEDTYRHKMPTSIRIVYHAPILPDSVGLLRCTKRDDTFCVAIHADGRLCTLMELGYGALDG